MKRLVIIAILYNNNDMKILTFNQLQLRLFAILFLLFTSAVFGYRYFVELPKLEQAIAKLSERELDTLNFNVSNMIDGLARTNFDYAVWTASYDFIRSRDKNFIAENFVENTFRSLKIDGFFYIDEQLKAVYVKGMHHRELLDLQFSFYDFEKNPHNLNMLPSVTTQTAAPKKAGFINTVNGPALYSATQIRDSSMNGEARGFLIMVKLLQAPFISDLSKFTLTDIRYHPFDSDDQLSQLHNWNDKAKITEVAPYTDIVIRDNNGKPVSLLRMEHSIGFLPKLINQQSIIFIILISLFIYLVYLLVSTLIIVPVQKLAVEIKARDNIKRYDPLNEHYAVRELVLVSRNVNELMSTVQKQNDILAKQVNTDSLTQVLNRRGLIAAMQRYKDLCIRNNVGFITVMADIDYFKNYNDAAGHLEGDIALSQVALLLNEHCRRAGDVCARYGGEEFTLLFSEMEESKLREKLASIMNALQQRALPHPCSPIADYITISMGAVIVKASDVSDFNLSLNEVFRVADRGLYAAKKSGRDCFVINSFSKQDINN